MTSIPASACLPTTSATADRMRAARAAGSTGTPSSLATIIRIRSSGRGRLPVCVVRKRSVLRRMVFAALSERRARELAAEDDQPPGSALRIPAEANVVRERVLISEEPLDGVPIVDAVRASQGVERIDRLGAEPHRVCHVPLEAQFLLDRRRAVLPGDSLGPETVRPDDEPRRVDLRPRAGDAELHRLEIAHAHGRVARAPLPDRLERQLEGGLRVADAGGREAMRAEGREGHAVQRIRVDPCAWELAAAAGQGHAESPVLGDENVYGAHRL